MAGHTRRRILSYQAALGLPVADVLLSLHSPSISRQKKENIEAYNGVSSGNAMYRSASLFRSGHAFHQVIHYPYVQPYGAT
jgi:hypothetical protein